MPTPLVIRADASSRIGTGHVMRMLALAQAAADRGSPVLFVCAEIPEPLRQRLQNEGFQVEIIAAEPGGSEDVGRTLDAAQRHAGRDASAGWIVTDGYAFAAGYQHAVRAAGYRLLVVDDYNHLPAYECDILLNQNIGAEALPYNAPAYVRRLLGPRYAMLRREFREAIRCGAPDAGTGPRDEVRLLVTMGGADIHHMTGKVLHALSGLNDIAFHVRAVVGAAYPKFDELVAALPAGPHRLECLRNVEDMPALMRWADLAVTAAGSTCWELLALGVPMAVVVVAENQERIGALLGEQGYAVDLGWHDAWSDDRFRDAIRRLVKEPVTAGTFRAAGRQLVDGRGVDRILDAMTRASMILRPARSEDARMVWSWANDPETRAASFNSAEIPWEDHARWYQGRLGDPSARLFIAEAGGAPLGIVRFEAGGAGNSVISVAVAPEFRSRGVGADLIALGVRAYAPDAGGRTVLAYIKTGNERSRRAFEKAGFRLVGETLVREQPALVMEIRPGALQAYDAMTGVP